MLDWLKCCKPQNVTLSKSHQKCLSMYVYVVITFNAPQRMIINVRKTWTFLHDKGIDNKEISNMDPQIRWETNLSLRCHIPVRIYV